MPHIAAFGQAAFGKDVLSNYLKEKLNNGILWERASFADAVKRVFEESFGYDREFIEKWKRIPEPPEGLELPVRQSLQLIGDGFRKVKNSVWIDKVLNKMQNVIITDGRYLNEAKAIKEHRREALLPKFEEEVMSALLKDEEQLDLDLEPFGNATVKGGTITYKTKGRYKTP
jgi:hypothetical protein